MLERKITGGIQTSRTFHFRGHKYILEIILRYEVVENIMVQGSVFAR